MRRAMIRIAGPLRRLSLRDRFLVAPLLGLLLLGVLLAAFIYESQRQNALLTELAERHLGAFDRYSGLFVDLSARHVDLYEFLITSPAGNGREFRSQAGSHLHAVVEAIDKLEDAVKKESGHRDAELLALHRKLLALTQAYRQSVATAVETKTAGRVRSPLRIARVNERFAAMNQVFSRLLDSSHQRLVDEITAGVERSRMRNLMIASAAVGGGVLLLAFSLALARLLSRSLRAQAAALSELGGPPSDVRRPDGDEVQCIAGAIAALRHAQQALRASEQRFRLFFEHNNAVILLVDPADGAIRDANESASRFYGYAREDLCAMTIQQINQSPPEDVAAERENAQRELRNYFIFPHRLADGRVRSVEVHATPIDVAGALLLFCIVHDITERRNAEEQLRLLNRDLEQRIAERTLALWNEKSLLRTLIDALPDLITVKDAGGRYLACNRAFARAIAGCPESEVLGKRAIDILPAAQAAEFEEIERLVMTTGASHKQERVVRCADGRDVLLELIRTPFHDRNGGIVGTIGIGHDVTERDHREQSLREAQATADEANRAKSAFLAAMSHEIRTPMHGVVGMIELIGETARSAKQRRMVETARNSAFALLRIIDDILDFSKIEAGKLTIERIPVSIQEIVESVANMLAPIAIRSGIRLMLHYDPFLPPAILGDQVRLSQILVNLASNAIKFSRPADGVPARVLIRVERSGDSGFRMIVRDHGIGMTPAQIDRLFQPFSQGDVSTTRRFGGTGLGLTICKRLVDQMGGTIEVESAQGAGATFRVGLPLEPATPVTAPPAAPDLSGLRILAFIDLPELEEAVAMTLRAAGVETVCCGTMTAVAAAGEERRHFDVVLLRVDDEEDGVLRLFAPDETQPAWASAKKILLRTHPDSGVQTEGPDALVIRCCPLLPSILLDAVAKAGGRMASGTTDGGEQRDMPSTPAPSVEQAEREGRLILVAEDNEINREVIARQLDVLGHAALIAADGKAALELWRMHRFGLLLTDCHMPEMDGFQLTQAIRQHERCTRTRLPIVAITANAMRGEAQRCLAAGMDAFLSKPFELQEVRRILARWLPATGSPAPAWPASAAAHPPVDISMLAKMVGDDPDMQARLLDKFISSSGSLLDELRTAGESRRLQDVASAAHKLKASCRLVGATAAGDVSEALEAAAAAGNGAEAGERLRELECLMLSVFDQLLAMRADAAPPASCNALRQRL